MARNKFWYLVFGSRPLCCVCPRSGELISKNPGIIFDTGAPDHWWPGPGPGQLVTCHNIPPKFLNSVTRCHKVSGIGAEEKESLVIGIVNVLWRGYTRPAGALWGSPLGLEWGQKGGWRLVMISHHIAHHHHWLIITRGQSHHQTKQSLKFEQFKT